MKRFIRTLLMLAAVLIMATALPSCHSSRKAGKGKHKADTENLRSSHGKKDGKDNKERPRSNNSIVKEAYTWLGTPYAYGRADKGVACDCSGMVMSVYEKVKGVKLPRNSSQQRDFCKSLKEREVKAGDLCFFATGKDPKKVSHVGIMIDDCNFIHASASKGVVVSDITTSYYQRTFMGYGRVP